jgi:hypothetical protein
MMRSQTGRALGQQVKRREAADRRERMSAREVEAA